MDGHWAAIVALADASRHYKGYKANAAKQQKTIGRGVSVLDDSEKVCILLWRSTREQPNVLLKEGRQFVANLKKQHTVELNTGNFGQAITCVMTDDSIPFVTFFYFIYADECIC